MGWSMKLSTARNELDAVNHNLERIVEKRTQELREEVRVRKRAQDEAEQANEVKSMFIANMSHELRTPMTGIFGMARILESTELNEDQKKFLDVLLRNSKILLTVINDILDYSKLEAEALTLEVGKIELDPCIDNVINLFAVQASEKGITLGCSIDNMVPKGITGDANRLAQVLINLVSNALKFSEHGKVDINVSLYGDKQSGMLLFSVSDTGIGIAKDQQSNLFDAFTQADSSTTRKYGGTGLGLAICKQITELMGGRIWMESEIGVGSTFYFTIQLDLSQMSTPSAIG